MICLHCREGGYVMATPSENPAVDRHVAGELHARCREGTWCDCQHVMKFKPGSTPV